MARHQIPERLTTRLYGYSEADHLADLSRGTAKRWLEGYSYSRAAGARVTQPPVTPGRPITQGGVSFLDLVELVAIGGFKRHGFAVSAIRKIVANCQELFEDPYPLATQTFKTDGRDVFVNKDSILHDVLHRKGATAWYDVLAPFLSTLDYKGPLASRWWPLGTDRGIMIDPEYGFGLPVVANSGVRTEIIRERIESGDSIAQVSYDFNLKAEEVESAIQFELQRAA